MTDLEVIPVFCPMRNHEDIIEDAVKKYQSREVRALYPVSCMTERDAYNWQEAREGRAPLKPVRPRIREVAEFCKSLGVKRIGVAFCIGLADEASRAVEILEGNSLEVCSVLCKCGAIDKVVLAHRKSIR